jgi:uncharacterized protein YeaO (DUF488 family)
MTAKIKRVYEEAAAGDGRRVLVDRLWPRGIKKENARIDEWLREIAPTNELRQWFGHDPAKWAEFRKRYRRELAEQAPLVERLRRQTRQGTITLLYSAKDEEHNNAVVLKDLVDGEG